MDFSTAIRTCLTRKFATFSGRASRSEYWFFQLLFWLLSAVLLFGVAITGSEFFLILLGAAILVLLIPSLAVLVRRLHDLNKSGLWALLLVLNGIPYIGFLVSIGFLVICCLRGTIGPNNYGEDPLELPAKAA